MRSLFQTDPEVFDAIARETHRQNDNIELIASENFTSPAVMEACGSADQQIRRRLSRQTLLRRLPVRRRFRVLAIERAKKLFSAEHANVQPHSGSQANFAAYFL